MKYIRIALYAIVTIYILNIPDKSDCLNRVGFILLAITVDSIIANKSNGFLCIFITILSIANISLAYGCFWFYENNLNTWQYEISGTSAHYIAAKMFVIWYVVLNIGINLAFKKPKGISDMSLRNIFFVNWEIGPIVFFLGYIFIILIFTFGIVRSTEEYNAGASALYEYAVIIFLIIWIVMPKKFFYYCLMIIFGIAYIMQGLMFGDRSSAFPMIMLLYLLLVKTIKLSQMMALSVFGILGANFIGLYRTSFTFSSNLIEQAMDRLLYVDSIGYSFYAGVQIVRASSVLVYEKMDTFISWLKSLLLGTKALGEHNLAYYVQDWSSSFANGGGGMPFSHFYFWFGEVGVVISALISGFILGKIFSKSTSLFTYLQVVLLVLSLRWYIYSPTGLYRSCIIIPTILYFIIKLAERIFNLRPSR